jgi:hypothetical protein
MVTKHAPSIDCLVILLCALLSGCSPMQIRESLPWERDPEAPKPSRLLAIWSDTVLHSPSKPAMRGFGGRVFFYSDGESDPIEVDGTVMVYAFDAKKLDKNDAAPEKKFVFPAKNLAGHYSKCSLGHSYSFWLPWDKVGGATRQISLIVRYEGQDGTVVLSETSRKLLPGIAANPVVDSVTVQSQRETVQQVGYAAPAAESTDAHTIPLTPSMTDRLRRTGNGQPWQQATAQDRHFQALEQLHATAALGSQATASSPPPTGANSPFSEATYSSVVGAGFPAATAPWGPPPNSAPVLGPLDQQSAADYQPKISQVPFASTAQRIGAGWPNRPPLGASRFDHPPARIPDIPAGR